MKTKSNASFYSRFGHIVDFCDETSDFGVSSSDFFQPLCDIWSHADRIKIGNLIMDAVEKTVHNSYAKRCSDLRVSHLPRDHLLNRLDSLLANSVTWVIIDSQFTKTRHIGLNLFDALRNFVLTDSTVMLIDAEYDEYNASVTLFPNMPSRDVRSGPSAAAPSASSSFSIRPEPTFHERFAKLVDYSDGSSDFNVPSSDFLKQLSALWQNRRQFRTCNLIMDEVEKMLQTVYSKHCAKLGVSQVRGYKFLHRLDSLLSMHVSWAVVNPQYTAQYMGSSLFDDLRTFTFDDSTIVKIILNYDENKAMYGLYPDEPSERVLRHAVSTHSGLTPISSSSSSTSDKSGADKSAIKSTPPNDAHAAPSANPSSSSPKEAPNQRASMVVKSYPRFEMLLCDKTSDVYRIEPTHPAFIDDIRKHFGFRKDLKIGDAVLLHDCPWHEEPHQFTLFQVSALPSAGDMCYVLKLVQTAKVVNDEDAPKFIYRCATKCPTGYASTAQSQSGKVGGGVSGSDTKPSSVDASVKSNDAEPSPPSDSTVFTNEEVESIQESLQNLLEMLRSCEPEQQMALVVKTRVAAAATMVGVILCAFIAMKRLAQKKKDANAAAACNPSSSPAPQQTATCAAPCIPKADDRAQSAAASQVKATPASSSPPATASADSLLEKLNDDYWKRDPIIMRSSHRDDHPASSDHPIDWMKIYRGADSTIVPAPVYAPTTGTVATPSTRPHFGGN